VLLRQAEMIMRVAEDSVPEPNDLTEIRARFERLNEISLALPSDAPS